MPRGRALSMSPQPASRVRTWHSDAPGGGRSLDPSNDQTFSAHPQPLISRNYKGDVAMSEIDHFMPLLMQREEEGALTPLLSHGRVHFLWTSAPAPSIQYRASNLDWQLISYMIFFMFQCHSPKSSHRLPLPQSP